MASLNDTFTEEELLTIKESMLALRTVINKSYQKVNSITDSQGNEFRVSFPQVDMSSDPSDRTLSNFAYHMLQPLYEINDCLDHINAAIRLLNTGKD